MKGIFFGKNHQQGFTVIELLVAAVLGLFVLGSVLHIFSETKKSYRVQDALARLQENGQFALELLAKDIRMAGYLGCSSKVQLKNTLKTPLDFIYDFAVPLQGFDATSATAWTPAITTAIAAAIPSAIGGSDIITLRRADDQNFIVKNHALPTASLVLETSASIPAATKATVINLQSADFLNDEAINNCATAVVSDCSSAAVFQITAITTASMTLAHANATGTGSCTPKNDTDDLGKTYVNGLVYPMNTITYYIRANPSSQPALYRKVGKNYAEELVEGIEQMQVLYGVDTDATADGVANYYVKASSVTEWAKVTSVRVSVLAVSLDDNLSDMSVAYVFDGSSKTSGDKRLRRGFTSTIAIRNRQS